MCDHSAVSWKYGPWNPGIRSDLPTRLLPLSTLFRPENVYTSVEQARELRDLTGLELDELVIFRPERLALHELLIRVTADFEIPDPEGALIRDLGANFRRITQTILTHYIEPHRQEIASRSFGYEIEKQNREWGDRNERG